MAEFDNFKNVSDSKSEPCVLLSISTTDPKKIFPNKIKSCKDMAMGVLKRNQD